MQALSQFRGKTLWAALAVLIDGEGCIYVGKDMKSNGTLSYYPGLVVSNTNKAWLDSWQTRTERGYVVPVADKRDDRKAQYAWKINKRADVVYILKRILPYLFCKAAQAETVISFIEDKVVFAKGHYHDPMNAEELQRRENAYQRMRKLNAKGKPERLYAEGPQVEDRDIVRPTEPSVELGANVLTQ